MSGTNPVVLTLYASKGHFIMQEAPPRSAPGLPEGVGMGTDTDALIGEAGKTPLHIRINYEKVGFYLNSAASGLTNGTGENYHDLLLDKFREIVDKYSHDSYEYTVVETSGRTHKTDRLTNEKRESALVTEPLEKGIALANSAKQTYTNFFNTTFGIEVKIQYENNSVMRLTDMKRDDGAFVFAKKSGKKTDVVVSVTPSTPHP